MTTHMFMHAIAAPGNCLHTYTHMHNSRVIGSHIPGSGSLEHDHSVVNHNVCQLAHFAGPLLLRSHVLVHTNVPVRDQDSFGIFQNAETDISELYVCMCLLIHTSTCTIHTLAHALIPSTCAFVSMLRKPRHSHKSHSQCKTTYLSSFQAPWLIRLIASHPCALRMSYNLSTPSPKLTRGGLTLVILVPALAVSRAASAPLDVKSISPAVGLTTAPSKPLPSPWKKPVAPFCVNTCHESNLVIAG
jgi:hypothetical protein